jgi:phosphatidylglycerol lysyltransferase
MDDHAWPPSVRRARDLVLAHGWNATAYQIVNPGITHWFASSGEAVIGYVRHSGVRVVAGAPVAPEALLADVAGEFERDARRAGDSVCYFAAEARLEAAYGRSSRHSRALLGAQPAWHPREWRQAVDGHRSLRAQLHRARNKGVRVSRWSPARAAHDAALRTVLARWLETRRLPPLHFLVEPETLTRLDDRRVFVATRDAASPAAGAATSGAAAVVAFAVASPIPCRRGWLLEQFIRDPSAPNGTIEYLLDRAVDALGHAGATYITLGLAPLARRQREATAPEPPWLRFVLGWMRAHGRRFYDFGGLEAFKTKFRPSGWEPVYAIANEPRFSPRFLYAIAGAFGARSPAAFLAQAVGRAAVQEVQWLISGRRGR